MNPVRTPTTDDSTSIAVNFASVRLTDEQFEQLCRDNPDVRLELTAEGELIAMPPTGSETGARNMRLSHRLQSWSEKDGNGIAFDSSTGFALPYGARRSPDASWLRKERWETLSEQARQGFAPLCTDFVVELRSPADDLEALRQKMVEYMGNGAELGWLIDPIERNVHVFRRGDDEEVLVPPHSVDASPTLPGFVLRLEDIW